jgi:hypothetical protein
MAGFFVDARLGAIALSWSFYERFSLFIATRTLKFVASGFNGCSHWLASKSSLSSF